MVLSTQQAAIRSLRLFHLASKTPASPWNDRTSFPVCRQYVNMACINQLRQTSVDHTNTLLSKEPDVIYLPSALKSTE